MRDYLSMFITWCSQARAKFSLSSKCRVLKKISRLNVSKHILVCEMIETASNRMYQNEINKAPFCTLQLVTTIGLAPGIWGIVGFCEYNWMQRLKLWIPLRVKRVNGAERRVHGSERNGKEHMNGRWLGRLACETRMGEGRGDLVGGVGRINMRVVGQRGHRL